MAAIHWPPKYLPGTTNNFVSNETYVPHTTVDTVWSNLSNTSKWESYYDNVSQITPPPSGPTLSKGDHFRFSTFGFPPLDAEVLECEKPTTTGPGRLSWRAWQNGDDQTALDICHAWIVEGTDWGAVRILTQESQIGKPAVELAGTKPNVMLNGHQDWVDGLARISRD